MTVRVRVKQLSTGHEYTIARSRLQPGKHRVLNKPAVDRYGRPLPAKHNLRLFQPHPRPSDQAEATEESA